MSRERLDGWERLKSIQAATSGRDHAILPVIRSVRVCRVADIECFHNCAPGTCLRQPLTHPNAHCEKCGTWLFDSEQLQAAAVEYDGDVIETPGVCPECGSTDLKRRGQ